MNEERQSGGMFLQAILLRHRAELRGYVVKLLPRELGRTVEPNDLLQEAYIDAMGTGASWDGPDRDDASMVRLLKTIIRRNVIDLLRRHRLGKQVCGDGVGVNDLLLDSTERLIEQMVKYDRTPSQSAMSHEVHAMVEQTLAKLQPDHALALQLRYASGLSLKDVGEKMSRSQEAAEQLCRRAITELRGYLSIVLPV